MEIKILKTTTASACPLGIYSKEYVEGSVVDMYDSLAKIFLEQGWAEKAEPEAETEVEVEVETEAETEVEAETKVEEKSITEDKIKNKAIDKAPENKSLSESKAKKRK
jgi:hypothetical protein